MPASRTGPVRTIVSSILYTGTIAVADPFSGDKAVTLAATIDPNKVSQLIPLKNSQSNGSGAPVFGRFSQAAAFTYSHVDISATQFLFKGVSNSGSGAQTIDYAVRVVVLK